jgi:hypothetical protein
MYPSYTIHGDGVKLKATSQVPELVQVTKQQIRGCLSSAQFLTFLCSTWSSLDTIGLSRCHARDAYTWRQLVLSLQHTGLRAPRQRPFGSLGGRVDDSQLHIPHLLGLAGK